MLAYSERGSCRQIITDTRELRLNLARASNSGTRLYCCWRIYVFTLCINSYLYGHSNSIFSRLGNMNNFYYTALHPANLFRLNAIPRDGYIRVCSTKEKYALKDVCMGVGRSFPPYTHFHLHTWAPYKTEHYMRVIDMIPELVYYWARP